MIFPYTYSFPLSYKLRVGGRLPIHEIGDGDGMSGVRIDFVVDFYSESAMLDADMRHLLWQDMETKLGGGRARLLGSLQRCRIVAYDTQEVNEYVEKLVN